MADFKLDLVAYYDTHATERAGRERLDYRVEMQQRFAEMLMAEGRTTLVEFGAGTGRDAAAFCQAGLRVLALDLSPRHVAACRERGLKAEVADVMSLNLPAAGFQAGWAMSSLLHVPDDALPGVLAKIADVLEPGAPLGVGLWGDVARAAWTHDDPDDPRRFWLRTDAEVKRLLTQTFVLESFETHVLDEPDRTSHYQFAIVRTPGQGVC